MNPNDIKKLLRPLVKQLVKEAMQEELTTVITEIIKQTSGNVMESKKQTPVIREELSKERMIEKQKLHEESRKMLEEMSKKAYGGINLFEGTTPLGSAGSVNEGVSAARAADPLSDTDPNDPGVDIGGLLRITGGWKQIRK
jgi:hypothetical protein